MNMKDIYISYLFQHHIMVSTKDCRDDASRAERIGGRNAMALCVLTTLGQKFGIRLIPCKAIREDFPSYINENLIQVAADNIGEYVPGPFYRGFPESVKRLTQDQILFDKLYHYAQTYGAGFWDQAGHSVFEEDIERAAFKENTEPKDYILMDEASAEAELKNLLTELVCMPRPLNLSMEILLRTALEDFQYKFLPNDIQLIRCKKTLIQMLYWTKDVEKFGKGLHMPDVIKLLDYIQYTEYGSENLKALNLKNQDRKLLIRLIHEMGKTLTLTNYDVCRCFSKRKIWVGLLHHLHIKPVCPQEAAFFELLRRKNYSNKSPESFFEWAMKNGECRYAAKNLKNDKGLGELVRRLDYILSRCETEEEVKEVLACLEA